MKIAEYAVVSQASRQYILAESVTYKQTSVPTRSLAAADEKSDDDENASLSLSDAAKKMLDDFKAKQAKQKADTRNAAADTVKSDEVGAVSTVTATDPQDAQLKLLETLLSKFLGREIKLRRETPDITGKGGAEANAPNSGDAIKNLGATGSLSSGNPISLTMTVTNEFQYYRYESESVSYSAKGVINTADGQRIAVDMNLNMSRETAEYFSYKSSYETPMCDPLVINYAGGAAELSDTKFDFDLDLDGDKDHISFAAQGSGFLALDKNGDGAINDGSELFGPQSGSGFGELRSYDSDQNGWIDENDDIYSMLRIWAKDSNGDDLLYTLKELDVGAIYLGDVSTEYDTGNGQMRSTSFYLKDSGGAGYISHIDMAV